MSISPALERPAQSPTRAVSAPALSSNESCNNFKLPQEFRSNDQLAAINKHLDAVPLNKVISGDLVVLTGHPGRREQWGIVTVGKDGQLFVHHADSHYWSKTSLTELSESSRLLEAYRPQPKLIS